MALTLRTLLGHISRRHGRSPYFHITCGLDGCDAEYRVFNSFFYHLKRKHFDFLDNGRPPTQPLNFVSTRFGQENDDTLIFRGCVSFDRVEAAPSQDGLDVEAAPSQEDRSDGPDSPTQVDNENSSSTCTNNQDQASEHTDIHLEMIQTDLQSTVSFFMSKEPCALPIVWMPIELAVK